MTTTEAATGSVAAFSKFTGKQSCRAKVAEWPVTLLKKKNTLAQVFPCEFCEIFKNTVLTEHFWTTASASSIGSFITFWLKTGTY